MRRPQLLLPVLVLLAVPQLGAAQDVTASPQPRTQFPADSMLSFGFLRGRFLLGPEPWCIRFVSWTTPSPDARRLPLGYPWSPPTDCPQGYTPLGSSSPPTIPVEMQRGNHPSRLVDAWPMMPSSPGNVLLRLESRRPGSDTTLVLHCSLGGSTDASDFSGVCARLQPVLVGQRPHLLPGSVPELPVDSALALTIDAITGDRGRLPHCVDLDALAPLGVRYLPVSSGRLLSYAECPPDLRPSWIVRVDSAGNRVTTPRPPGHIDPVHLAVALPLRFPGGITVTEVVVSTGSSTVYTCEPRRPIEGPTICGVLMRLDH